MIQEGLWRGLPTDSFCAISCAPVGIPFLVSDMRPNETNSARSPRTANEGLLTMDLGSRGEIS